MSRNSVDGHGSKGVGRGLRLRWGLVAICLLWIVSLAPDQWRGELPARNRPTPAASIPTAEAENQPEREARSARTAVSSREGSLTDVQEPAPRRIFSREMLSTTLISASRSGEPGNGASSAVAIAAGGRFVAFVSEASNLMPAEVTDSEDRGYDHVFVYDRSEQAMELISASMAGDPGNGWSGAPAITPDGRHVAFYSWASNLVEGDTNGVQDLFVYDRQIKQMERVSVDSDGRQANGRAGDNRRDVHPALSADGRYVAFHAAADNLVAGDTNQVVDVFVYDRREHATARVSVASNRLQANADAERPSLSADGRYVAFQSRATNLDQTRLNVAGVSQIYVHDRVTGATELVSRSSSGVLADADAMHVALSGDGQLVFFQSAAANLVSQGPSGLPNRSDDIFVHDRTTGTTSIISVASSGIQANRNSFAPAVSLDGRYVAYLSAASNLADHDTNGVVDVFVHDRLLRHTTRASVAVTGRWTGEEADGNATGTPSISLGGQLVAFVSLAGNLFVGDDNQLPDVFVHARQNPTAYAVAGTVVDTRNQGIEGALVVSGAHQARTNRDGHYVFPNLVGGTYTLRVAAPDYEFAPHRQTVSVLRDLTVEPFVGYPAHEAGVPFLDLPIDYDDTIAGFLVALRDTDDGGRVDAWFDHDTPDYAKNGGILLWDGYQRVQGAYNPDLGCYARRCYDGHDGIDFPYEDPAPETEDVYEPVVVRAAAAGRVVAIHVDCTEPRGTQTPSRWSGAPAGRICNGGYGNEIIIYHGNGYFTRYAHLDEVLALADSMLTSGDEIGVMGSTGNSNGVHLHFAVHWDNGNGRWDGEDVDGAVDPFGWAGDGLDPWSPNGFDASFFSSFSESDAKKHASNLPMVSHRLWRVGTATEANLLGGMGVTLQDATGRIVATIPAGALDGQAKIELVTGSAAAAPGPRAQTLPTSGRVPIPRRSLGYPFQLNLLEWLTPAAPVPASSSMQLAQPIEFTLDLAGVVAQHVDLEQAQLYRWSPDEQQWQVLPTLYQPVSRADGGVTNEERGDGNHGALLYSATDRLGAFDLQAPLLCPQDVTEPDDAYFSASSLRPGGAPRVGRFDTVEDEDWLRFEAEPGRRYTVAVGTSTADSDNNEGKYAPNVLVEMQIYEADGLTPVAGLGVQPYGAGGDGGAVMSWSPIRTGRYFVRLTPAAASQIGCEAGYTVRIGVE